MSYIVSLRSLLHCFASLIVNGYRSRDNSTMSEAKQYNNVTIQQCNNVTIERSETIQQFNNETR